MEVLFAASEAVPFIKTGGLADVIGSLPLELRKKGVDARLILPLYRDVPFPFKEKMSLRKKMPLSMGWRYQHFSLLELESEGMPVYFIDNEYYFDRHGIYDFRDDAERFAFFCRAVLESLPYLGFKPQILHTHDWHTGLVNLFLKALYGQHPFFQDIKSVFTVHNLNYQGLFPWEMLEELLDLPEEYYSMEGIEFYGQGSYLKAGLVFADYLTTVSETYVREIQTPEYGEKLEGLLQKRKHSLSGIINGIDYQFYDPTGDPQVKFPYRASYTEKCKNKPFLQESLGLPQNEEIPLVAFINRLVEQKGLDLLREALEEIMALELQLVFLGTGEQKYEAFLRGASYDYPHKIAVQLRFDEQLARRIYAGADLFLMPSLYEPCGIGQLIALRYGTIPLVRETGGLKDTVLPFDAKTGEGNGFVFTEYKKEALLSTLKEALKTYQDREKWALIMKNATEMDFSWKSSAEQYQKLYSSLLHN